MKILVYGHKGWIGKQFMSILREKGNHYILGESRVDNIDDVINELNTYKPTHVISFIGRTHGSIGDKQFTTIDYLEQPGKLRENVCDNLYAPISLALACKDQGIHYTYLGTGCIFKYKNNLHECTILDYESNGFSESDLPNFFGSGYSTVKGFTDRLMHQLDKYVLNLRIRMPIVGEDNPRNFITKITHYEKICSIPNSMTVLPELLPMVLEMMGKNVVGTMNLTNPGTISHNEILALYKEYVDPTFTWKNFSSEEQRKILASERSNNLLDTTRLEYFFPDVRSIKQAVKELMTTYKRENTSNNLHLTDTVLTDTVLTDTVLTDTVLTDTVLTDTYTHIDFKDISTNVIFVTGGAGFIGSNFINKTLSEY